MRILWVTTKVPYPPIDGGRLAVAATLEALAAAGAELTLVAPKPEAAAGRAAPAAVEDRMVGNFVRTVLLPSHPLSWTKAIVRGFASGRPVQIERHAHAALRSAVGDLATREGFDVVHAEQLQSLSMAAPARAAGAALVLRAQNVESGVWDAIAGGRDPLRSALARIEAGRRRRSEAAAIGRVDATIALSTTDAARLSDLNPSAHVVVVPPPFVASMGSMESMQSMSTPSMHQSGDVPPVFTWLGSRGWPPNEEALRWLMAEVWPAIAARLPQARLDIFGGEPGAAGHASIAWRPAPRDSAEAFGAGTIMLLPLRTAAGVRMRLLEAWARGAPVIASPAAVDGLDTEHGRDVLVAADPAQFADAAARLTTTPALRAHLVEQGRATLARRHDPATIAHAILDVYRDAIARRRG
jgi:hypothetical protein